MQHNYRFWGIPEYLRIKRELRETVTSHSTAVKMLERSVLPVFAMSGLSEMLATEEGKQIILERIKAIDTGRNMLNSVVIDTGGEGGGNESYDFRSFPLTGVRDIIETTNNLLSSVTNIPQTILFGRSPAGMNATGDGDLESWYNFVERIQKLMLKGNLKKLIDIIVCAGLNSGKFEDKPDINLKFNPLWSASEEEEAKIEQTKAATRQTNAQTAKTYFDMGVLDPSEIRKGLKEEGDFLIEGLLEDFEAGNELSDLYGSEDVDLPSMDGLEVGSGIGVLIIKDGKILTGKRTDNGLICGPGGHIEPGESPKAAAIRETKEEFGINPKKLKLLGQLDSHDKPYVYLCTKYKGKPKCSSDEMQAHKWMTLEELRKTPQSDLFPPFRASLELISQEKLQELEKIAKNSLTNDGTKVRMIKENFNFDERNNCILTDDIVLDGNCSGCGRFYSKAGCTNEKCGHVGKTVPSVPDKPKNPHINAYDPPSTATGGSDGEDSLLAHTGNDGRLTEEREQLHRQLINETFDNKEPVDGQATHIIMGGGSGAGKGALLKAGLVGDDSFAKIDSDDIKTEMPEFNKMIRSNDNEIADRAAGFTHEESSALAKRMVEIAHENNFNSILDGTGTDVAGKIAEAKAAGKRVEGVYVTIPLEDARQRVIDRGNSTGRKIDPDVVVKKHKGATREAIARAADFDFIRLYDNSGPVPILIATGGNRQGLTATQGNEERYLAFLERG